MMKDKQELFAHYPDLVDDGSDPQLVRLVRDLDALYSTTLPSVGLGVSIEQSLEKNVIRHGYGGAPPTGVFGKQLAMRRLPKPRWHGGWSGSLLTRRVAVVVILLALGITFAGSPEVQAQLSRLTYFVQGFGIRQSNAPDLVASGPVSITRGDATLTVDNVFSSGGRTAVQVEIRVQPGRSTLQSNPESIRAALGQTRLILRDAAGQVYQPRGVTRGSAGGSAAGGSQNISGEWTFDALRPEIRSAEVLVDSPAPFGNWKVQVPVIPVQQAGLPQAQEGGSSVKVHGITLSVTSVVPGAEVTAVKLASQADPQVGLVRSIGADTPERQLMLTDDLGREYLENNYAELSSSRPTEFPDGTRAEDILFPPLPADVRSAELVVPYVVVVEDVGTADLAVPVGGKKIGERIPIEATLALGPNSFRVPYGEIVKSDAIGRRPGERTLVLHIELGSWQEDRMLTGIGQVLSDGTQVGVQLKTDGADGQLTQVRIPLYTGNEGQATVTFRNAAVAVRGPWRLRVPVH